ncbi:hypothetical protein MPSEU_000811400 [Mayamaea pseudoterrestris]|nr:hypothetical protein MPSEU_000811400 [Mayamaea pseudoterrestris]
MCDTFDCTHEAHSPLLKLRTRRLFGMAAHSVLLVNASRFASPLFVPINKKDRPESIDRPKMRFPDCSANCTCAFIYDWRPKAPLAQVDIPVSDTFGGRCRVFDECVGQICLYF